MKKLLTGIILIVMIGAFSALGQGWRYLAGGHLDCVKVIGQHIWAGGTDGMIWRSSDGGRTWSLTHSGQKEYFTAMAFADTANGWVVSDPGNIYATKNGGITWTRQYSGSDRLWGVTCVDAMHTWAVGDNTAILATRNGGASWIQQGGSGREILRGVSFPDLYHGWTTGWYQYGFLFQTSDAGNTWNAIQSDFWANSIIFVDSLRGWVTYPWGDSLGNIKATSDGGLTWRNQRLAGVMNGGIDFVDLNHGWVTGGPTGIARTTNSGVNWIPENRGTSFGLWRVSFTDTSNGWAVGDGQVMVASSDGGASWSERRKSVSGAKSSVSFPDSLHGWSCGDGKWSFTATNLLRTTNGGATWDSIAYFNSATSVTFVDSLRGWLTLGYDKQILSTTDGGNTWIVEVGGTSSSATSASFSDRDHGWVTCCAGYIMDYIHGAWFNQVGITTRDLYRVASTDSFHAWIVGDSGTILATTDGGGAWVPQSSGYLYPLYGVAFTDSGYGWVVGDRGVILATTNGGSLWNPQNSGVSQPLYAVKFVNRSRGWAVGYRGTILETTNGGITWFPDSVITGYDLYDLTFTDENHGWTVGVDGITLGYGRSGNAGVGEGAPGNPKPEKGDMLIENHPNPFRRATVFRYRLSGRSLVILNIYDVQGRVVRHLVRTPPPGESPGEHSTVWDGRDEEGRSVPSGVYFYELHAQDKTKTNKLILLR